MGSFLRSDPYIYCLFRIGEYSARKIHFFPGQRKNCEKISPYFSLKEVENCPKLHFFLEKIVEISIFLGGKLQKLANLGVKIEKNCIF